MAQVAILNGLSSVLIGLSCRQVPVETACSALRTLWTVASAVVPLICLTTCGLMDGRKLTYLAVEPAVHVHRVDNAGRRGGASQAEGAGCGQGQVSHPVRGRRAGKSTHRPSHVLDYRVIPVHQVRCVHAVATGVTRPHSVHSGVAETRTRGEGMEVNESTPLRVVRQRGGWLSSAWLRFQCVTSKRAENSDPGGKDKLLPDSPPFANGLCDRGGSQPDRYQAAARTSGRRD